jgi:nicotinamide mononucleotide adenylyltransferase
MGIRWTRWLDAEEGVRRSKIRRWESEDTEERIEGLCGEKAEEYVQECVGRVSREVGRWGDHYW